MKNNKKNSEFDVNFKFAVDAHSQTPTWAFFGIICALFFILALIFLVATLVSKKTEDGQYAQQSQMYEMASFRDSDLESLTDKNINDSLLVVSR